VKIGQVQSKMPSKEGDGAGAECASAVKSEVILSEEEQLQAAHWLCGLRSKAAAEQGERPDEGGRGRRPPGVMGELWAKEEEEHKDPEDEDLTAFKTNETTLDPKAEHDVKN
jgi:hypothetical protein